LIEHTPWRGQNYESGIGGQRIAVVGYSHHRGPSQVDCEDFTEDVVRCVIEGQQERESFFGPIRGYFGYDDNAAFWNRVLFFNFLPDCIGVTDQRYETGSPSQIVHGKRRFLRIIREEKPDKVFVFTVKGWRSFPRTIQEEAGEARILLGTNFPKFSWGTYAAGKHTVMAFGLRHPQFANGQLMQLAVRDILTMRA